VVLKPPCGEENAPMMLGLGLGLKIVEVERTKVR
jgi:hypothetical protein